MNSTNKLVEEIRQRFEIIDVIHPDDQQVILDIDKMHLHTLLSHLKADGFRQLSLLSAVDWIKDNIFELVYIVFNWDTGVHVLARVKLPRDNPRFRTITPIYPGAQYYERDVHEFFGIEFEGNPMSYKPLFLELWDEMPPMRKDFDPEAYSREKFPERVYVPHFVPKVEVIE
ncbi:MAG: NADH dehydrogenase [delta proteobacterium ML8_F1]|nr:MAG: NADH dehydrogenase [delta proteobacterium ML8_F1]